ncbi:hypothetical protein Ahy_A10g049665 [Arachis hypogaea]|uniref:FAR1 domain-containing protein n=1 Tax=Arachis hypogaea TaxID=3818 RepID=A0A445B7N0_ARAHY|nr:hypothetical protein Ahy_A10g049665 [Arachis hypogaea]
MWQASYVNTFWLGIVTSSADGTLGQGEAAATSPSLRRSKLTLASTITCRRQWEWYTAPRRSSHPRNSAVVLSFLFLSPPHPLLACPTCARLLALSFASEWSSSAWWLLPAVPACRCRFCLPVSPKCRRNYWVLVFRLSRCRREKELVGNPDCLPPERWSRSRSRLLFAVGFGAVWQLALVTFVGVHLIAVIEGPALRIWHCVGNILMDVPQAVDINAMCDKGTGVMGAVDFGDVADITKNDILRKVFRSEGDAYEFYKRLGKFYRFGIRRRDMFKDEKGNLVWRRFFCNREGQRDKKHYNRIDRKRSHKPETMTNCEARMCIYLDKESSL